MKHKVAELYGVLLDQAVALCENVDIHFDCEEEWCYRYVPKRVCGLDVAVTECYAPSRVWNDGGPLLERERIQPVPRDEGDWAAIAPSTGNCIGPCGYGPTLLIAAMRAFVASRFGDEVDLP